MKYREILDEYILLLKTREENLLEYESLPKGYVVVKKISGKDYYYLQYTINGKKKSIYIKNDQLEITRKALDRRNELKLELKNNDDNLQRLERAARILDFELSQAMYFLKQGFIMDSTPIQKRAKVLSFAKAMTALEGLPATEETDKNLELWAEGKVRFSDFYFPTLKKYRIVGE